MLASVDMVIFAIQAAMKMGEKVITIIGDEVRDRDLVVPAVKVDDYLPSWIEAEDFFSSEAGKTFISVGGMYAQWWQGRDTPKFKNKLQLAYLAIQNNLEVQQADDLTNYSRGSLEKFSPVALVKQWREGADPKRNPVQRLAGTMVELALDYVKIDPTLFGGNGKGTRLLKGFLLSLDEVQFAEDDFDDLLVDIVQASFGALKTNADLVISDKALRPLFQSLSGTLAEDFKKVKASNEPDKLVALNRVRQEMLEHVVGTTAVTLAGYPDKFLGTSSGEQLLKGVLQATLTAVQDNPELFSSSALAAIYTASLKAAAQNAALLVPGGNGQTHVFLTSLVTALAQKLADTAAAAPTSLFSLDILPAVSEIALGVLAQNAAKLINPKNPQEQLLAEALARVSLALSTDFHGDQKLAKKLQSLLSQDHLLALLQEVFGAVAQYPEGLLPGMDNDPKRSALAQLVGSVALAAGHDTKNLLNGDGFVKLLEVALEAFAKNPDRLLDLNTQDPSQNIMAKVMTSVVTTAAKNLEDDGRNLLSGDTLVQLIDAALAAVSQNTDGFKKEPDIVTLVLGRLLFAASHSLANELDANNLLLAFAPILRLALRGREALDVSDAQLILPHLSLS
jgi:hypothetical protein